MAILAVILTDTHIAASNVDTNILVWKQAIAKAVSLNVPIIHAGDIFDDRRKTPVLECWLCFYEILDMAAKANVKIYAIPGNHDKPDYLSNLSYLDVFKNREHFTVFDDGGMIALPGISLYMYPYFREDIYGEKLKSFLDRDENLEEGMRILVTHIAVSGVKNNDGTKIENNIDERMFEYFDRVYVGHYHDASRVNSKVWYIGSSFQHTFGETPDKGITLLHEDGAIETIETDYPRYLKVVIGGSDQKQVETQVRNYKKEHPVDHIKFVFTDPDRLIDPSFISDMPGVRYEIKKNEEEDGVVLNNVEIENLQLKAISSTEVVSLFEEFCTTRGYSLETYKKYLKQ